VKGFAFLTGGTSVTGNQRSGKSQKSATKRVNGGGCCGRRETSHCPGGVLKKLGIVAGTLRGRKKERGTLRWRNGINSSTVPPNNHKKAGKEEKRFSGREKNHSTEVHQKKNTTTKRGRMSCHPKQGGIPRRVSGGETGDDLG